MKIAVLGAGSCFAMNLSRHLINRGDEVLAISRSPMRSKPFTYGLENEPLFRYEREHLSYTKSVMMWLDYFKPDAIVNFAALCEVGLSWKHPVDYYKTNVLSLVELCNELQKRPWFKKFLQIGSCEVYGSVSEPASETARINPSSPYAASKAAFDFHLQAIARHEAFNASILMPSNGYCEGQTLNRIIPKTIIACLTGKKIQLQGGGVARKSYLHADDISNAVKIVLDKGGVGEVYNVGPDDPISIRDVVCRLAASLGKQPEEVAEVAQERTGQDSQYWLDSTKIKDLGWTQTISLEEGFERMIAWVRKYPELLKMDKSYTHKP